MDDLHRLLAHGPPCLQEQVEMNYFISRSKTFLMGKKLRSSSSSTPGPVVYLMPREPQTPQDRHENARRRQQALVGPLFLPASTYTQPSSDLRNFSTNEPQNCLQYALSFDRGLCRLAVPEIASVGHSASCPTSQLLASQVTLAAGRSTCLVPFAFCSMNAKLSAKGNGSFMTI